MSVFVTATTFKNAIDLTPVNFALANVGEEIVIEHAISIKEYCLSSTTTPWVFNNTDGYVVTAGKPWITGGDFSKFKIGDIINYYQTGGVFYAGIVIVDKLSNTEIQIGTDPAGWAANTAGTTNILSIATPVTALSYKWNFIENEEATNYYSKIDGTTQMATIKALNPAGAGTNKPMTFIGAESYQIGSVVVDEVSLVTSPIYSSNFIIRHTTRITPFMLAEQWDDIQADIKPNYFFNLACLKSVFFFEARYNLTDPNNIQTFEKDTDLGNTGWFDENFNSSLTNYSISSLVYKDAALVTIPTPQLLPGNVTTFTFDINNTTDTPFVHLSTQLVINFGKAPISETEYQLNGRDVKHNFVWESKLLTVATTPVAVNGDNYSDTTIRSLSNLKATRLSASVVKITGNLSFHADSVAVFEESDVPSYMMWVSVQDHTKVGLVSDRTNLRVDFNKFYYQAAFPNLITFNRKKLIPHITNVLDATAYSIGTTFAEDELVGYTKITVGTDALVTSFELTKVTHRIKALNKVTDEEFTLESKTINLPYINVVGGFQNFDLALDKNIRIPATEIRKQITSKSLTTPGEFQFSYPFLTRWEYWNPINNGNSFFYDSTKPNNNLNNDWFKYSNVGYGGDWTLQYECEISTKVNGSPASYIGTTDFVAFDRNYTHIAPDSDVTYTIKTYDGATELVNGTGTRYILGYKNTLVKALFVCPTMTSSKAEVVVGLEVFEEGGVIGKRRMSSLYPSDSDTWFVPLSGQLQVKVSNPTATSILAEVEIDYTLIQSLVGKKKWKITARAYNDPDKMSTQLTDIDNYGYLASAEFTMIGENPVDTETIVTTAKQLDCCSDLVWNVLADTATSDALKNDVSRFLWWFNEDAVDTATVYLNQDGKTIATLSSSTTYGTPYNYGFNTNGQKEKMVGYEIEWKKVLTLLGEGSYQLKCVSTTIFGGTTTQIAEGIYCLSQYTDARANNTVRIEYTINGLLGNTKNDEKRRDFGQLNWYNQHRFEGFFCFKSAPLKEEDVVYTSGQRQVVESEQEPEYTLELKPIPAFKHDILRTDILQADTKMITDYNNDNFDNYYKKKVKAKSGYDPKMYPKKSKLASVVLTFIQEFNNLKKHRS